MKYRSVLMKNKKQLIIAILTLSALVTSIVIGVQNTGNVFAADGESQGNGTTSYLQGKPYASGQVIIIYENNMKANAAAEIINNNLNEKQEILSEQSQLTETDQAQSSINTTKQQNSPVPSQEQPSISVFPRAIVKEKYKNLLVVKIDDGIEVAEYIKEAQKQPGVKFVQPNYAYKLSATVTDPIANDNSEGGGWHLHTIDAFEAWDYGFGSSDVVVGIIDTGVDLDNSDLDGNIIDNWDTFHHDGSAEAAYNEWHGTAVSGFVAAEANGVGICGVAPQAKLIVVDAYDESNLLFYTSDIIEAIDYLMNHTENGHEPVDIINMSLSGFGTDTALTNKIVEAYDAGIVVVAAAGNENSSATVSPSDIPSVISVMASTIDDDYLWSSSNYGAAKDITAPGVSLAMTYPGDDYSRSGSGTSFSAPIVAGAAALMLSMDPTLDPAEVAEILYLTAFDTATQKVPGGTDYGAGRLDVYAAIQEVQSRIRVTGITVEGGQIDIGETLQLEPVIIPANAANKTVFYESSNIEVATVSDTGLVTAVSPGTVTITVTAQDGGIQGTCQVISGYSNPDTGAKSMVCPSDSKTITVVAPSNLPTVKWKQAILEKK